MEQEKKSVKIIPYEDSYRDAFRDINYQWLTQYFEVTEYDQPFFENPRKEILEKKGYIFLASLENEIVGSVALERITDKEYTLAKMGVKSGFQGLRIGQLLMDKAVEKAEELNLESLVLYTNHQLVQALNLYSKYGFRFERFENPLVERATIKMVKKLVLP
ncbi:GNAT family N-acetyltransferase [Mesonia sp. K4-1]|jgi:ribosomal protein S18 acetylase RimI-like enzyme|uniref:GNAT family N-acetyltransferase n=1 Tax=Mesonia sp. K4-1 TaxID=2602760 RepID=UPI0011CACDF3|nr:GNAT family N-acetyltransferase [Mesonia sp. K4-1]TXK75116.1 GNAT family N-acetyltransferase [Mesonia sp. K4-1]